jgi:hypothetical protein
MSLSCTQEGGLSHNDLRRWVMTVITVIDVSRRLLFIAAGAFLIAGCEGDDGSDGGPGTIGQTGSDGFSCWDLNQNGALDAPDEDLNGDGFIDTLDFRVPLPGTAVTGNVTTAAGPLDRFASRYWQSAMQTRAHWSN